MYVATDKYIHIFIWWFHIVVMDQMCLKVEQHWAKRCKLFVFLFFFFSTIMRAYRKLYCQNWKLQAEKDWEILAQRIRALMNFGTAILTVQFVAQSFNPHGRKEMKHFSSSVLQQNWTHYTKRMLLYLSFLVLFFFFTEVLKDLGFWCHWKELGHFHVLFSF